MSKILALSGISRQQMKKAVELSGGILLLKKAKCLVVLYASNFS